MFKPLAVVTALAMCIGQVASFDLTILHTNDVHARITSTDEKGELVGGVARRKTKVDEIRKEKKNVLLLDAGDQFQGTVWFNIYGGQEAAHFMNLLGYDAQGLGNHEFDRGSPALSDYIDAAKHAVLSCNIDASKDPLLKGKIKPWTVVEKEGRKIAIIGYTTEETVFLASPSKETVFKPVLEALPGCIADVKAQHPDVNIIIGVGHAGYYADLKIAEANPDLDILVGGHTNTFLYMGEPIQKEEPEGPYPTVIEHADGRKTVYVTDYAFAKYLGHLDATFDDKGEITSFSGNPILLSSETTDMYNATAEDPAMLEEVAKWEANVTAIKNEKIGTNMLYLLGDRSVCRQRECNLGNLITDSYVHYLFKLAENGHIDYKPAICMINGGSIRADIQEGDVSMGSVLEVAPFQNTVVVVHVPGDKIMEALEHGVGSVETGEGRFPQVSGMTFKFDPSLPSGSRILEAKIVCTTCDHPELVPIDPATTYPVIMSSYSSEGGDGYSMFVGLKRDDFEILDSDPIEDYIRTIAPVHYAEQGRIIRVENVNSEEGAPTESAPTESAPAPAPEASSSSGPSTGTIIFIVAIGVVGIIVGAVVTGLFMRNKNKKATDDESRVTLS